MKKLPITVLGAFLALSLAACSSDESIGTTDSETTEQKKQTDTETNTTEQPASDVIEETGNVVQVVVKGTNFEFDTQEVRVKAGDTIQLTYDNENGAHGLGIDEFNVDIKAGETVEFVADQRGEFDYYCTVLCGSGHDTMDGKFIVE